MCFNFFKHFAKQSEQTLGALSSSDRGRGRIRRPLSAPACASLNFTVWRWSCLSYFLNKKAVTRFLFKLSSFCFTPKLCSWIQGIWGWTITKFIWKTSVWLLYETFFSQSQVCLGLSLFFDVEAGQIEAYSFKTTTPLTSQTKKDPSWFRGSIAKEGLISVCMPIPWKKTVMYLSVRYIGPCCGQST